MRPGNASLAADTPLLDQLFGPGFREGAWPDRPHAVHGTPDRLPAALRGPELAGFDALAARYRGPLSFGRGLKEARTLEMQAHPANLYRLGLTVYLHDIAPVVAGADALLRGIEQELALPAACARLAAFASPEADGVSPHFDGEEVISVQLQGRKTFRIGKVAGLEAPWGPQYGPGMLPPDSLYPQVPQGFPEPDEAALETVVMAPGSVLFLPRGTWHRTEAAADSLSVSLILRPPAAFEVLLQQLQLALLQDPAWRRPLHGGEGAAALLAGLPDLLGRLGIDALLPGASPARFQRIPQSRLSVDGAPGRRRLTVTAWDRDWLDRQTLSIDVGEAVLPVLDWLQRRAAAFSLDALAADFPAAPVEFLTTLLDSLARAQFLRRLWFAPVAPT